MPSAQSLTRLIKLPVFVQLLKFAAIGAFCTAVYTGLYIVLRAPLGAQWSNVFASAICASISVTLNQHFTFGLKSVSNPLRTYVEGLSVYLSGLVLTSGALFVTDALSQTDSTFWELAAVSFVSLAVGLTKFLCLRFWVFHPRRRIASGVSLPTG